MIQDSCPLLFHFCTIQICDIHFWISAVSLDAHNCWTAPVDPSAHSNMSLSDPFVVHAQVFVRMWNCGMLSFNTVSKCSWSILRRVALICHFVRKHAQHANVALLVGMVELSPESFTGSHRAALSPWCWHK